MLTTEEIKQFIDEDAASEKKRFARVGQRYYEGEHDIKDYEMYYYNDAGRLIKDTTRSNIKISHPFFTELVDQATQYILSGKDGYIKSDLPELQTELDRYFNENEDFTAEVSEAITDCQVKGFAYMYATKKDDEETAFRCADAIGVVEVEARFASDNKDHVLYWYIDRIDKDGKRIKKIMDYDDENVSYYRQEDNGEIVADNCYNGKHTRLHTVYREEESGDLYGEAFGFVPFFRLDNNKKQTSGLKTIKGLIDDYDLMSCGLSNNIQDASEYLVVVKGYEGSKLDEVITNTKVKKHIGVDEDGGVDFKTVDIPYEARKVKLEHDEKNIYRFGMGLNTSGLKDTSATTNIAIKAAYSSLDLKCSKMIIKLKQFLRKIIKVVLDEINEAQGTDYQQKDVYFNFVPEVMSNEQENATIAHVQAQEQQVRINTLLSLATQLDNETFQKSLCDILDLDWDEVRDKLPKINEAEETIANTQATLNEIPTEE